MQPMRAEGWVAMPHGHDEAAPRPLDAVAPSGEFMGGRDKPGHDGRG